MSSNELATTFPDEAIDVAIFGFATSPHENSAAQERMRRHAILHPGSTYRFSPGVYNLTTPRFLYGVRNIEVIAYGASFRNVNAGKFGYSDLYASFYIGSGSVFHPMNDGNLDLSRATSGERIHTVRAGDTAVWLLRPEKAADFSPGGWALVHWFSRQEQGFPPNPAYFDYVRIVAANGDVGLLTLDRPLTFDYKAIAPDDASPKETYGGTATGAARVLCLDRPDYQICERFVLRGGKGVRVGTKISPGYDGTLEIAGAIDVQVHDAEFDGFFPSMARNVEANDSVFRANSEIDKIIETVSLKNCVLTDLAQGTGVRHFEMDGGRLQSSGREGWNTSVRSREVIFRNVDIAAQYFRPGGAQVLLDWAKSSVLVQGCRFYPDEEQSSAFVFGALDFVPDGLTATTMTISPHNPAWRQIMRAIDITSTISLEAGNEPQIFTVNDLAFDAAGTLVATGGFTGAVALDPQAKRFLRSTRRFVDAGDNQIIDAPPGFKLLPATRSIAEPRQGFDPASRILEFAVHRGEAFSAPVQGRVDEITIDVVRPYKGLDETATLALENHGVGRAHDFGSINCKATGVRRVSTRDIRGAVQGDRLVAEIPDMLWVELLSFDLHGSATRGFVDQGQPPKIVVHVKTGSL
ncbi:hypothetical protein [uncultured Rhodoblastus sp.]|uniref:hypothetical protein n=1 Tax=uncultured Rhodoblastus sp. TaxID=543037 RepID=UPI0025F261DD|nr:hypothetical protein [uncultured Rhodoblastus sp.]